MIALIDFVLIVSLGMAVITLVAIVVVPYAAGVQRRWLESKPPRVDEPVRYWGPGAPRDS